MDSFLTEVERESNRSCIPRATSCHRSPMVSAAFHNFFLSEIFSPGQSAIFIIGFEIFPQ